MFWTTSGTPSGDQQSSYTQSHLSTFARVVAACRGYEGVAHDYLNELACAANGANTVAVATGGALVDGKAFVNDASQNVNIPSAVGGGNTRIDRIVLRANWAGFNVSVVRIAGVDAASPTAPAITQTSGTTYDIMLCQVLVNTSGTVTVTDERVFAKVDATGLGADSVDDTKAGDRVPQLYRRQGGSSTSWASAGSTAYTPGAVRIQKGVRTVTIPLNGYSDSVSVSFPVAFSQVPMIQVSIQSIAGTLDGRAFTVYTSGISASGFTLYARRANNPNDENDVTIAWEATGTE
jgi:hypothetical protein